MMNRLLEQIGLFGRQRRRHARFRLVFRSKGNIVPRMTQGVVPQILANALELEFLEFTVDLIRMVLCLWSAIR
jgi:hypothetical protein